MTSPPSPLPEHPLFPCPPFSEALIPLPPHYISPAFYLCFPTFPLTLHYVPIIVKTAVIAALKQRTVLILTPSFFYYTSILPLPSSTCPSWSPTYTECSCLHLYRGPVALIPPLLWSCCLTSTYCGPVTILPLLLWSCCLTSISTVVLLPYSHFYHSYPCSLNLFFLHHNVPI